MCQWYAHSQASTFYVCMCQSYESFDSIRSFYASHPRAGGRRWLPVIGVIVIVYILESRIQQLRHPTPIPEAQPKRASCPPPPPPLLGPHKAVIARSGPTRESRQHPPITLSQASPPRQSPRLPRPRHAGLRLPARPVLGRALEARRPGLRPPLPH
jgi:hypothetical protein